MGINNQEWITGYGHIQRNGDITSVPGFLWEGEYVVNLEDLDGFTHTFASDINDENQIIGFSNNPGFNDHQAFIWEDGLIQNLNNLVAIDPDIYFDIQKSHAINQNGAITAQVDSNDGVLTILLTPLQTLAGDLTCDGYVDGSDLSQFLSVWDTSDQYADFSGDGVVNGTDLGLLLGYWNPR